MEQQRAGWQAILNNFGRYVEARVDTAGRVVALRYLTTDGRTEMGWPCRVVQDSEQMLALFIAAGSGYKAGPRRTAPPEAFHAAGGTPASMSTCGATRYAA